MKLFLFSVFMQCRESGPCLQTEELERPGFARIMPITSAALPCPQLLLFIPVMNRTCPEPALYIGKSVFLS